MINVLTGFPANVLAFAGTARITRHDYETVLVPAVQNSMRQGGKVRLYYQIGPDFAGLDAGAMWADFKIGMEYLSRWERIAVVTDVDWIGQAVRAFNFLMSCEVKLFPLEDAGAARAWIIGDGAA